jgi:YfiH family protein
MFGYSQKPYHSLNMAFHVGDESERVIRNRERVCRTLGYSIDSMIAMQQKHTGNIRIIDRSFMGRGAREWEDGIENTDGIVTDSKGLVLAGMAADCSLNMLYDPAGKVLAVVHCGWKGVVSSVLRNTISAMVHAFRCKRENILVGIGPTICEKCYEVGDNLIAAIEKAFPRRMDTILSKTIKGRRSVNIVKALQMQLCDEGVLNSHIEISHLCNACRVDEFFSYRIENKNTGRFGLFAVLN